MISNKIDFPVFEANQVLTNDHLNSARNYLDEQNRLTRVTLHGVGVVCGLDVSVPDAGNNLMVSQGVGVTSEGYLVIVGNEPFLADRYRQYVVPQEDGYAPFIAIQNEALPLLELLDKTHDNYDIGLSLTQDVLTNKVVLLFVELLAENLKNCSPASCDDKGRKVTVTIRKLLIDQTLLGKLNVYLKDQVEKAHATGDFYPDWTARLNLPDLRLPRLNFELKNNVDAEVIFSAYQDILNPEFFTRLRVALSEGYKAFKPLLPDLPFDLYLSELLFAIEDRFGKLYSGEDIVQTQYYYDFIDDLIQAYDEFRWRALEVASLCNPPEALFPRHLELGEVNGSNFAGQKIHRHYFRPSPALTANKARIDEVRQLFQRLRLMVETFDPSTPNSGLSITPSQLGCAPLSDKAVPFYYKIKEDNDLVSAWNYQKTRTGRVQENLGYHIDTRYHRDEKDISPLHYDLEKFNFFRIEGHIGLEWRPVLKQLLEQIQTYRLPFDVIALNAHPMTANASAQSTGCFSNDLQVFYNSWLKELECQMRSDIRIISAIKLPVASKPLPSSENAPLSPPSAIRIEAVDAIRSSNVTSAINLQPKVNLLSSLSSSANTLGLAVSETLAGKTDQASIAETLTRDVQNTLKDRVDTSQLTVADFNLAVNKPVELVSTMLSFADALPDDAADLKFSTLSQRYQDMVKAAKGYKDLLNQADAASGGSPPILPEQKDKVIGVIDHLTDECLIERLQELGAELERRRKQLEELTFFNKFIRKHPGLEHKAGTTKGGTFVLVYQETPAEIIEDDRGSFLTNKLNGELKSGASLSHNLSDSAVKKSSALTNQQKKALFSTLDSQGLTLSEEILNSIMLDHERLIPRSADGIPNFVVIADFYLPYRCSSHCPPVQFVLPPPRPIFTLTQECQGTDGYSAVRFSFTRRTEPCEYSLDNAPYELLVDDQIKLNPGKHKIVVRDAEGGISLPQYIEIFAKLALEPQTPVCAADYQTYTVRIIASNVQLPIRVFDAEGQNGQDVLAVPVGDDANTFSISVGPFESGKATTIQVGDSSAICLPQTLKFEHTCIPLQTQPDEVDTVVGQPVIIKVLDNDSGVNLRILSASVNPDQGKVAVNADQTLIFTPNSNQFRQDVIVTYTVTDGVNTTQENATVHVKCNQPCDGMTLRQGYGFTYPDMGLGEAQIKLTLEMPQGNIIDLSKELRSLFFQFGGMIDAFTLNLNRLIQKHTGIPNWLTIDPKFEPPKFSNFIIADCTIEYYECLKFELDFEWLAIESKQKNILNLSPKGTYIMSEANGIKAAIPPFDPVQIDRCDPTLPETASCKEGVNMKLAIKAEFLPPQEGTAASMRFVAVSEGNEKAVAYFWQIDGGLPSFSSDNEVTVNFFNDRDSSSRRIRLSAFTEKHCRIVHEEDINIFAG